MGLVSPSTVIRHSVLSSLTKKSEISAVADTVEAIRLLVVSEDPAPLGSLLPIAESNGWSVDSVRNSWDAMDLLQSDSGPHAVFYELRRGAANDLFLLRWLHRLRPELAIIVACQPDDANKRNDAIKAGASTFLIRPIDQQELEAAIRRSLNDPAKDLDMELEHHGVQPVAEDEFFLTIGPLMHKVRAQAELLAQSDVPALIVGEAGTGKVTVARLIHKLSVHSGFDFHRVNCSAIPPQLVESEIFGRKSGSNFSSNQAPNLGKLHDREHGTLLLEGIFDMPLPLQSKLADFLRQKQAGDNASSLQRGPRILATSDVNLEKAREENRLGDELYHRLAPFTIHVPALRRRKEEILVFLGYTINKLARRYDLPVREFSEQTITNCVNYSWPGNLEEMEDFVKRYLITGQDRLHATQPAYSFSHPFAASKGQPKNVAVPNVHSQGEKVDSLPPMSLKTLLENVKSHTERMAVAAALKQTRWNRKAAARLLGVSYRTLLYKVERYGMRSSDPEFELSSLKAKAAAEQPEIIRNRSAV